MNPRRKKRMMTVLAVVFGLGTAVALVLQALESNINLFYTPTELVEGKGPEKLKPFVGQKLRIGGMVVPGTVKRDQETLKVEFKLMDTGPSVKVIYNGILPDLFREGQGIVAQGKLISPNVIEASEVLAKHDENYMPPEIAEAMKDAKNEKYGYKESQLKDKG